MIVYAACAHCHAGEHARCNTELHPEEAQYLQQRANADASREARELARDLILQFLSRQGIPGERKDIALLPAAPSPGPPRVVLAFPLPQLKLHVSLSHSRTHRAAALFVSQT